jgi:predicted DNA-binding mobile mystery protein A
MSVKRLEKQHLNQKLSMFLSARSVGVPAIGWIKNIRLVLGMTTEQLGNRLGVSKQNVSNLEQREVNGGVTIKTLKEVATALEMDFVYGFVPKDQSIDHLFDRKAKELATQIVHRTAQQMVLEDQANHKLRLEKAIEEKADELITESPKLLWY